MRIIKYEYYSIMIIIINNGMIVKQTEASFSDMAKAASNLIKKDGITSIKIIDAVTQETLIDLQR